MLNSLRLLQYVTSFSEGRVRIRHPALRRQSVAQAAQKGLSAVEGVQSVSCNTLSGSVLVLYDSSMLDRERLVSLGIAWGGWLDAVQAGQSAEIPQVP